MGTDWEPRFSLQSVLDLSVASARRSRAVYVASAGGTRQVYSWDRGTGATTQLQGRDDIRCPSGQMERYLARVRKLGKDVEEHWFDGGHMTWATDANVALANTRLMLQFAIRQVT